MTKANINTTKLLSIKIRFFGRHFAFSFSKETRKLLSNFRFEIIIGFCSRKSRVQTKKCFEPMI